MRDHACIFYFSSLDPGFLLQGAGGALLKGVSPPKIKKTIERTIEAIAYCFKNTGLLFPSKISDTTNQDDHCPGHQGNEGKVRQFVKGGKSRNLDRFS